GADRTRRRVLRVRRAHQVPVLGNGVVAFEHLDHHWTGGHEFDETPEERTLAVHRVKAFGIGPGKPGHLRRYDLKAGALEARIDLSDNVFCNGIRLDDRKRTLYRHPGGPKRINTRKF